jgi:hypothetical protein
MAVREMRTGTYYLNNSGHKWVTYPKEKVLLFHGAEQYCKLRTIEYYEAFGNFAVCCLRYNGKMIKVFMEECHNDKRVLFVDYKERY